MSRKQIMLEILALVDSNPLENVDIAPIIEKNCEGLSFNEQITVRGTISSLLDELKTRDQIWYNPMAYSLVSRTGQTFLMNGLKIRSTITRDNEQSKIAQDKLREDLPAEKPIIQPNNEQKKITPITILKSCWDIISKNPLISAILALIIGSIILKHYHII